MGKRSTRKQRIIRALTPRRVRRALVSTPVDTALSRRALSLLRAVRVGRAELVCGCVPHLLVDRLHVCDSDTLTLAGLIAPAIPGQAGMRVLARLTDAGMSALEVAW